MREWLSGRALPCQGKCREFESRFPLHTKKRIGFTPICFFVLHRKRVVANSQVRVTEQVLLAREYAEGLPRKSNGVDFAQGKRHYLVSRFLHGLIRNSPVRVTEQSLIAREYVEGLPRKSNRVDFAQGKRHYLVSRSAGYFRTRSSLLTTFALVEKGDRRRVGGG